MFIIKPINPKNNQTLISDENVLHSIFFYLKRVVITYFIASQGKGDFGQGSRTWI